MGTLLYAAPRIAFVMFWDIFWGLSLGFLLSAVIEELVSKDEMSPLLPDSRPRNIAIASALGAVSSSCSYAAWRRRSAMLPSPWRVMLWKDILVGVHGSVHRRRRFLTISPGMSTRKAEPPSFSTRSSRSAW